MDALSQQLMQQLTAEGGLSEIGRQIGADEQTTGPALAVAIPLLVSALAGNSSTPEGAQSLHNALSRDHDGSILGDLSGFLSDPQSANGAGILSHILGSQQPAVAQGLAQGTGLNNPQIGMLLQIIAPLLLGALGKKQREQHLDTDGLSSYLGQQQRAAQQPGSDLGSMLNGMLDADKDGSAVDDVTGMMGKLFGGR